ncbi:hypothetical protein CCO03_17030 [Comamonas serinivorans]|uniref:Uncharacterized protein n=1 Tax=Comamonas serinivorans TaxID=1082851 RepID=A0A1Y0ERV1_9BURK|nr:hypothetical protein [Comamonas serinivorans]ARU06150.1 hypothetical protein CCO03_17030 [Comamonas serinivorans]
MAAIDWERIELDYRAGIKTLRQIAEEHGITHGAINKRAKRDGWVRDLSQKIQAKADALVSKAAVSSEVSRESKFTERQVVDANAQTVADVRLAHRHDIHRARRLTNALLSELEQQTDPQTLALLSDLGDALRNPDERGNDKLNDLYQAIISLPERSKTLKVLAESLQKLVDMERTAFGMDKEPPREASQLGEWLAAMGVSGRSALPVVKDAEGDA